MRFLPVTPLSNKWSMLQTSVWLRIAATLAMIAVALALTEVLWLFVDRPVSSPLFLVAIVVASWACGFPYGILAAILGGIVIDYFFVQPQYEFSGSRDEIVRLVVFVLEGGILSWLVERLRIAGEEVRNSH